MNALDIYLSALNGWKLPEPKQQERSAEKKRQEPRRLAGGCLLYRLHGKKEKGRAKC